MTQSFATRTLVKTFTFALSLMAIAPLARAQSASRERISINADWKFTKGDPDGVGDTLSYGTIKNWMMASGESLVRDADAARHARPEGNLGADVAYTQPGFNDGQWRSLSLPHDWGIEGPFNPQASGATGRLPFWGVGWYRKHLTIPAADQGKQIFLDVDGAMSYPNVWLNGQYVGGWGYGYSSFRLDLTPYIKPGADNVIAIRLDNPNASSRWYPGGGIYRSVWLTKTSPVHVAQWGTYLTTPAIQANDATVDVKINVDNQTKGETTATVRTAIYALDARDQHGPNAVASSDPITIQIPADGSAVAANVAHVANPALWSIATPNRYVAVTTIERDGRIVDSYDTPFGIRTIKFDPAAGFFLNGQLVKINGVCDHHDLGALGTAVVYRALERQIEMLKEMGCNAIRTSHNPPTPELLELCDKMGLVVMDETFDCWLQGKSTNDYHLLFADWSEKDTRMLVRRDRNHPSVVMWSIGNEIPEQTRPNGAEMAARLSRIVHEEDPSRITTSACNNAQPGSPFLASIDAIGLNYQGSRPSAQRPLGNYQPAHEQMPEKFIFGSETASTVSTRGEYTFPVAAQPGAIVSNGRGRGGGTGAPVGMDPVAHQVSSYDLYYPSWATSPDTEFGVQDRFPYVGGEFVWTGWDYLGEPTPFGAGGGGGRGRGPASTQAVVAPPTNPDTARSSYFGIIDLAGFKKDRFYLYQAHWRQGLPMAHILPHWNWPDRIGQVTPVHVYTSGDEGELFLNGQSLGRKKRDQFEYRIRWDDVQYQPGELKVVVYKNGRAWAQDVVKTTGVATKVTATPDRLRIAADGKDLSFVTVSIADAANLMVPRSMNPLKFSVTGPGEIVAVDNGDPTSFVPFQSHEMNAFNGLCMVIVRAKAGQAGPITLHAQSEGLEPVDVVITGL